MRHAVFLTTTLMLVCAPGGVMAQSAAARASGRAGIADRATAAVPRTEIRLAEGWRFLQAPAPGAERPDFVDTHWAAVSIPHSWNRAGYYLPDPASHIHRKENINIAKGEGWYRLAFTPPASLSGKLAWLQFDAASQAAEVWLNGVRLGAHQGGFSRFRFDATAALKPGQANVLVVKTDNTQPTATSSTADVLPLGGDFFIHGGLYRPVSLIATDPVHIDMMDAGGPGIYATTRSIDSGRAIVDVVTKLRNDGRTTSTLQVKVRLISADGVVAAEAVSPVSLRARADGVVRQTIEVNAARLWQGVADPYLYTLSVEVGTARGNVLDRLDQRFGIRQIRYDAQHGFFLNGKALRLHGVSYHQDREGKGWAVDPADVEADMAIMREMGANTIRLSHYQHGLPMHELADRHGMILWDEIPLVTKWLHGTPEPTAGLRENARQQLRELIRQNFNFASVGSWGLANEVDFGDSVPSFITGQPEDTPPADPLPLLRELNAVAKAEDPSRPTVLANCCEGKEGPAGAVIPTVALATDLNGANRYYGWYVGKPDDLGPHLDKLHALRPQQPLSVSEYGAGGATTLHTDDPLGGPADARGRDQPEEYLSYVHERNWRAIQSRPYLYASWLWNGFDFATNHRQEGDSEYINTKGLVTYDRRIRKDVYYFYKANWTTTPTVHVTGRRYVDRAYPVTAVRVYSNAPSTDLIVNGKSQGPLLNCPERICVWPKVMLAAGANSIVAKGEFTAGAVQDQVDWRIAPEALATFRIDSGALVAPVGAGQRFGSDTFFEGGQPGTVNQRGGRGQPAIFRDIAGAPNSLIAATYREGDFGYRVPLPNGRYTVTLTFIEPVAETGARRFDVTANGNKIVRDLDVAAVGGGKLKAVIRSFPVQVTTGEMHLRFAPTIGKAIVSSVEIAP